MHIEVVVRISRGRERDALGDRDTIAEIRVGDTVPGPEVPYSERDTTPAQPWAAGGEMLGSLVADVVSRGAMQLALAEEEDNARVEKARMERDTRALADSLPGEPRA